MNIQPVGNKILVEPLEKKEDKLESGIIIPGTANAELSEGRVVSVSTELNKLYKADDIVLFPQKSGVGQYIGNKAYLWIRHDEIWGILNEKVYKDKGDSL